MSRVQRGQLRRWPEGSLKSRSCQVYRVTNMFSAEQTNPHTHSARFPANEIRMSVKTRLVTDSSEVWAIYQQRARNGRRKLQHSLVVCHTSRKRPLPTLRARIRGCDVLLALAYRRLRIARPRLLVSVHTVETKNNYCRRWNCRWCTWSCHYNLYWASQVYYGKSSISCERIRLLKSAMPSVKCTWGYLLLFTIMYCYDFDVGDVVTLCLQGFVYTALAIFDRLWENAPYHACVYIYTCAFLVCWGYAFQVFSSNTSQPCLCTIAQESLICH